MIRPQPITAFFGVNGSGKSLSAVAFALSDLRKTGRPLVTNIDGISEEHVFYTDVKDLPDILPVMGSCNLIIDEAGAQFASRDAARNKAFEATCQQLRKLDARLMWTAPAYARADKILREVTLQAVLCTPLITRRREGNVWNSTRLVLQKSFDVSRVDNSSQAMNRNARATGFGLLRTAKWEREFDSFGLVQRGGVAQAPGK